mgnify:CR=1 FL=1
MVQPTAVPENELLPLLDRVRALEAEVVELRALLAEKQNENAATMVALRSQLASLRENYDAHRHHVEVSCITAKSIYDKTNLQACVHANFGGGGDPRTGPPLSGSK